MNASAAAETTGWAWLTAGIVLAALTLTAFNSDASVAEETLHPEDAAFLDSLINADFGFDPLITIRSYGEVAKDIGMEDPGAVYSVRFDSDFTGSDLDGRKLMASVIAAGRTAASSVNESYLLATVFTGNDWIMTMDTEACVRYSREFMDYTPEENSEFIRRNVIHSGHL